MYKKYVCLLLVISTLLGFSFLSCTAFASESPQDFLASVQKDIQHGKFVHAEKRLEVFLKKQQKASSQSREFLTAQIMLGHVIILQYDMERAKDFFEKARTTWRKILKADDPLALKFDYEFGLLLMAQNDFSAAQKVFTKTYAGQETSLGLEHEDTLKTRIALLDAEQELDAKKLQKEPFEACIIQVETSAQGNSYLLSQAFSSYARYLHHIDKSQEGLPLLLQHYENTVKKYGKVSFQSLAASQQLTDFYFKMQHIDAAQQRAMEDIEAIIQLEGPQSELLTDKYNAMGAFGLMQDDYVLAVNYWQKALDMCRKLYGNTSNRTLSNVNNLASALRHYGDFEQAKKLYLEAINISNENDIKDDDLVFFIYIGLSHVYMGQQKLQEAQKVLHDLKKKMNSMKTEPSMKLYLRARLAATILSMGKADEAYAELKDVYAQQVKLLGKYNAHTDETLNYLRQAALSTINFMEGQDLTRLLMGQTFLQRGFAHHNVAMQFSNVASIGVEISSESTRHFSYNLSIFYNKVAMLCLRMVRDTNEGLDKELLETYQKRIEAIYHNTLELLYKTGRYQEAFMVINLMKETELDDFLLEKTEHVDIIEDLFNFEERKFIKQLLEITKRLQSLGEKLLPLEKIRASLSDQQKKEAQTLDKQVSAVIQNDLKTFLDNLVQYYSNETNVQKQLNFTARNLNSLRKVVNSIQGTAMIIYPIVTGEYLYTYVITPTRVNAYAVKASSQDVLQLVTEFSGVLQNPRVDARPAAQKMYNLIMDPIENEVRRTKPSTLLFSLDGILRYIPMSALYDGNQWLVEKYDIVYFTEGARASLHKGGAQGSSMAALGLTKALSGFSALPAVAVEIDAIVQQGIHTGIVQGKAFLDDKFTYENFSHVLQEKTPMVHIASHFAFDAINQRDSFLLLGDGKRLTMGELFSQRKAILEHIDLLTLSACNTGSGVKRGDGREIESFGALAQRYGAKSVIASLWPVADASTAVFMREFYTEKNIHGRLKSSSLASVQRQFLQKKITSANSETAMLERGKVISPASSTPLKPSQSRDWSHPFFWAPFMLMGNWY